MHPFPDQLCPSTILVPTWASSLLLRLLLGPRHHPTQLQVQETRVSMCQGLHRAGWRCAALTHGEWQRGLWAGHGLCPGGKEELLTGDPGRPNLGKNILGYTNAQERNSCWDTLLSLQEGGCTLWERELENQGVPLSRLQGHFVVESVPGGFCKGSASPGSSTSSQAPSEVCSGHHSLKPAL